MENGAVERSTELESEDMTKHLEAEGYMNDGGVGHKRSLSGSLLSKLSFLRTTTEEVEAEKKPSESQASHGIRTGSMAAAVHEHRTRRRKGSLRKTALLGTGKLRQEHQTRPDHPQDSQSDFKSGNSTHRYPTLGNTVALGSRPKSNKGLGIQDLDYQIGPTRSIQLENSKGLDLLQTSEHVVGHAKPNSSPIISPTSAEASTTDDDDMLSLPQQLSPNLIDAPGSSTASSSYLNLQFSSLQRRRSSQKPKSPLSLLAGDALAASDDEWDYTETAWWGWVVLAVTWIVFVVGMGSCLEVWSWAWDVGETPYAPPELEDDPTLPIVGYYPALIILTAVMSWVWVVVAWVGMKYFRHAKISGDDG